MDREVIWGDSMLAIIAHPWLSSHTVDLIVINWFILSPTVFQTYSANHLKGINGFKDILKATYLTSIVDKVA